MLNKNLMLGLAASVVALIPSHAAAQEQQTEAVEATDDPIVVTAESRRKEVEALGKAIVRPSRAGKPVARFDSPLCVKVSGLPPEMAAIVKGRIEDNARQFRGVEVAGDDCSPNAFVGILNGVTDAVDTLRKEEKWLFEGLLSYQIDRIYAGSDAVRAWHVFDERNLDGSAIPGKQRGGSDSQSIASAVNRVEKSSRISQLRTNLVGAVVLVETASLKGKTFLQLADYATVRILASTSDNVGENPQPISTILTLFNEEIPPSRLTDFDIAYLESLYELPANSRDGQIIAAAVSRYMDQLKREDWDEDPVSN